MVYSKIIGTGSYIPSRVLTNRDIVEMGLIETSEEWIVDRTGILTRRVAGIDETNATMGAEALKKALENAEIPASNLDLIIIATNTSRSPFPPCGTQIQSIVGAGCPAFDIEAGCTGSSYAIATADAFIRSGMYKRVAVVGTDKLTEITNWRDRNTCVLFGDLASAMILGQSEKPGFIRHILGADGSQRSTIGLTKPDLERLAEIECGEQSLPIYTTGQGYLIMDGREVFKFVRELLPRLCLDLLQGSESSLDTYERVTYALRDVKGIFPHNANCRMTDAAIVKLAKSSGLALDELKGKFFERTSVFGNTSTASYLNSFHEARVEGFVKEGDLCMIIGFGAGLTWGGSLLRL